MGGTTCPKVGTEGGSWPRVRYDLPYDWDAFGVVEIDDPDDPDDPDTGRNRYIYGDERYYAND